MQNKIDPEKIDKIVKRLQKKYEISPEEVSGELKKMKELVSTGQTKVELQTPSSFKTASDPRLRTIAKTYFSFHLLLEPITKILAKTPVVRELSFYLYSSNMPFSTAQYLVLSVTSAFIIYAITLFILITTSFFSSFDLTVKLIAIFLVPFGLATLFFAILLLVPKRAAMKRGKEITAELPFALRHIATEISSGIGLYRTIQAIAALDYGPLSEEMARAVREIEEGLDTTEALKNLAYRTQSQPLKKACLHIVRAMRIGGTLSAVINDIAEDTSFEIQMQIREFAAKMNLFGVIFIFAIIVFPVMIAILGAIRNSALSSMATIFQAIPITIPFMFIFYIIILPFILVSLIVYIRSIQPRF